MSLRRRKPSEFKHTDVADMSMLFALGHADTDIADRLNTHVSAVEFARMVWDVATDAVNTVNEINLLITKETT